VLEIGRSRNKGGGQKTTAAVWAAVSGLTIGEAWLRRNESKPPELVARYNEAVALLERGVPFPYAVGVVGFRTLELKIDARALIPRPETEGLVDVVLRSVPPGGIAADIGTGSGCIALALAVEGRFDRVIAVERSPGAAELARENVKLVNPRTPVQVTQGNLLVPLGENGDRYRAIVSNPPYLTEAEYSTLDSLVRDFEPCDALVSGSDGLAVTRELLARAGALLEPGGILALEIDERRPEAICALGREYGWARIEIRNDLFGRPRYALATSWHGPGDRKPQED
jgi:release factor glutamine methyltransferase